MPPRKGIDWEAQIGGRLRLRDLHAFFTVVRHGSMAKAAAQLGVSQPAISKIVADLEYALGVRLLDRNRRGVEATTYGAALLRRGLAAFDELKQGVREIEFLADLGARRSADRVPGSGCRGLYAAAGRTFFKTVSSRRSARRQHHHVDRWAPCLA